MVMCSTILFLMLLLKKTFSDCRNVLTSNGIYISTLPIPEVILQSVLTAFIPGKKAKIVLENPNTQDLIFLKDLIEADKLRTVIDCIYPLQKLAEAHSYSEGERTVGKIAIVITH